MLQRVGKVQQGKASRLSLLRLRVTLSGEPHLQIFLVRKMKSHFDFRGATLLRRARMYRNFAYAITAT